MLFELLISRIDHKQHILIPKLWIFHTISLFVCHKKNPSNTFKLTYKTLHFRKPLHQHFFLENRCFHPCTPDLPLEISSTSTTRESNSYSKFAGEKLRSKAQVCLPQCQDPSIGGLRFLDNGEQHTWEHHITNDNGKGIFTCLSSSCSNTKNLLSMSRSLSVHFKSLDTKDL